MTRTPDSRALGGLPVFAGRVLFGISALGLFAAVIWWEALGKPWGPGASAAMAYVFVAIHVALAFRRVTPMDPLVWLPVAFLLFHFGSPVAIEWLGVPAKGGYDPWEGGSAPFLDRGYAVALLATTSFIWGVYLAGVRPLGDDPGRRPVGDRSLGVTSVFFMLGALVMVAAGIAIVGPSQLFGRYHEWEAAKILGADQRWIDTGLTFATAGGFALLASDERNARWRRWLAYLALTLIALISVQRGDRGGLVVLGVGAGWCYTQRIGRLRWPPVIAGAFVGLLVMPVIAEWRSQRSLEVSKRASVVQLVGDSLAEMGSSVNTIVYTIELIPERRGYSWGSTFRSAIIDAIPNLGLTKGRKFFARDSIEDNPSNWLVYILSPAWAATGGGYGFSMAAEWYFNFGLPGILAGMALVGWGVARVRNNVLRSSFALVWSATLFTGVALWVRNVVGFPLKAAVWPIIGLWVVHRLVTSVSRRRARQVVSDAPTHNPFTT